MAADLLSYQSSPMSPAVAITGARSAIPRVESARYPMPRGRQPLPPPSSCSLLRCVTPFLHRSNTSHTHP
jgi:hypothetical protein